MFIESVHACVLAKSLQSCLTSCYPINYSPQVMLSNYLILLCPFSCPQSFHESGSFPLSWLFASGGQIIGASASASVLKWIFRVDFLSDWLLWLPCCPKDYQESFPAPRFKSIKFSAFRFFTIQLSHPCMIAGKNKQTNKKKNIALTIQTFVSKEMSLFRFVRG